MPPHPLSRLDTAGQEYVSVCCRDYHSRLQQHAPHLLEEAIQKAPGDSRFALLCELLPIEVEHIKLRTGRLPTLHELCHAHPKLREYLPKAYTWVPIELRLPDVLGRYKVLKVLGEGGQGCVVQARDELDDRLVAIKYAAHPAHVSLLRREQMFLAQLAHKNIIEVLSAGDEPGLFYVVLPLRCGESLQLVYAEHRPDPALAAEITLQIARAIAHMHAKNVVHRDIKPGNIHLDPEAPAETVVLLDLGMSVDVAAWNAEDRRILEHGGTKAYMAPEQLASDESSDPKLSDVFALGAVLYFLLVGEPPLDRAAAPAVLRKAKAPGGLKRICRQALETRPSLRQPSAAKFAGEIERFLAKRSTHRVLTRLAIPLIPALVVGAIAALWMGMKETPASLNPLAGEELWVERTAREMGIDLDAISADDFEVTIEPIEYTVGSNSPLPGAKANVRIAVRADYPLDELMGEVEYRIGNCPWRNLLEGRMDGRSCNRLERREVEADGPVELRIDSMHDSGTGKVWGPYLYDMRISGAIGKKKAALIDDAAAKWSDPKEFWITEAADGWQLNMDGKSLNLDYVKALSCGLTQDNLRLTLPLDDGAGGMSPTFYQDFENASRVFGESEILYAQLHLTNGIKSAIRPFYAKHRAGYGGTVSGAKRFLATAAKQGRLASFSHGRLRLERLLVAAKEIAKLEIGEDEKSLSRIVAVDWQPTPQEWVRSRSKAALSYTAVKMDEAAINSISVVGEQCRQFIRVPAHWKSLAIRAVFHDGNGSDIAILANRIPLPGVSLSPVNATSEAPVLNLSAFIETGERFRGNYVREYMIDHFIHGLPGFERIVRVDHDWNATITTPFLTGDESSVSFLLRNVDGEEKGPYEYHIPSDARKQMIVAACIPLFREAPPLVHAFRCASKLDEHKRVWCFGEDEYGGAGTAHDLVSSKHYKSTDGVGIFAVGTSGSPLWRSVKEVRLGMASHQLDEVITPTRPSVTSPRDDRVIFLQKYGIDQTIYAQLVLLDGTELPSFQVKTQPLTQ